MEASGWPGRVALLLIAFCALRGAAGATVQQLSWEGCRNESKHLNQLARDFHNQTYEVMVDPENPDREDPSFPRVNCSHSCDPCSLRGGSQSCLQQIVQILHWYRDLFAWMTKAIERKEKFQNLVGVARGILQTMEALQQNLTKHGYASSGSDFESQSVHDWGWGIMLEKAAWNLISFSSIVARVFNPGNPHNHHPGAESNGLPCAQ
ncbi:interleukin-23 subunit alpha [Rhinatrema bivittatum]|uniref:interleukin-23 subunit alpha n=1 Tax=Rhinatrema bivittatum TaxID=194408 RepID=UPI00112C4DA9|nr:interleukin-23 subunit alpha [Rhinatrema bivittatum]